MQISVASTSLISVPIIEAILKSEHTLASIITNPDAKTGRGQQIKGNELAEWAEERSLPIAKPADNSQMNKHLLVSQPQLIVTCSYGKIIPVELLHGPRFGWLNVHFSLLPRFRGAAPVQWALLEGDTTTGITIFKLDKGMDTGPIYLQEEFDISPTDTTETLLDHMSHMSGDAVMKVIVDIQKAVRAKAQPTAGITLAPKISKEMAQMEWSATAHDLLRKERAIGVRPGIWTQFRGERLSLHGIEESIAINQLKKIGEIQVSGESILIRCADSILTIEEVTPAGKRRMSAGAFARGARIESGEKFE